MAQRLISSLAGRKIAVLFAGGLLAFGLVSWLPGQDTQKRPVPTKEQQAKSQALIDDIFKEDFKNAATPEAKSKLAAYLFQQGKESSDSLANRYVLYVLTRKLAAEAGNVTLALSAIEELNRQFQVDAPQLKAETLVIAAKFVQNREATDLATMALEMMKEAVEDDNYPAAKQLGEVALAAARQAKSVKLVTAIQKRNLEVQQLQEKYAKLNPFLLRLVNNPNDAEANLEMGKYYGLMKAKWAKAMPLLAKGTDADLKAQANKDLANPESPREQLEVADGWWDLAQKNKDLIETNMQIRAAYWYSKVVDKLSGLNRTKALKRIEQVSAELQVPITGVALGPAGKVGELRRLSGHNQEVKGLAFSPDGRYGLSGAVDNKLLLWDLKDGKQLQSFSGHSKQVWGVAFHPNGKQVVSSSWDATARLWDIQNGKELRRFTHPVDVNGVALSSDGKYMLVGCDDKFMRLWDVAGGTKIRDYTGPNNFVYGVAFSPDGKLVASGSLDQAARVYDKNSGQLLHTFDQHKNAVNVVEFAPDSKSLYTCGDEAVHQWEIGTGKELRRLSPGTGSIRTMAFSKDGRRMLTGGDDHVVRLWDLITGKQIQAFQGHTDQVSAVALSADGSYALSGDYSGTIILWALPR